MFAGTSLLQIQIFKEQALNVRVSGYCQIKTNQDSLLSDPRNDGVTIFLRLDEGDSEAYIST